MIKKNTFWSLSTLTILVLVIAFSFQVTATPNIVNNHSAKDLRTLDDKFNEVSGIVPEFGGMFLEGDALKVYLVKPEKKLAAEDAIISVFGRESVPRGGVKVLQGQYNFTKLKEWQGQMGGLFNIPGVVFTDVDESSNRLKIGVESSNLAGVVEEEMKKQGIPKGAYIIEQTEPIVFASTLEDNIRPLQGGIQITFSNNPRYYYACTLGFNGVRSGVNGFVVNSHCTYDQGGVDSTSYYQSLISPGNHIGTEIADPLYTSGGECPSGKDCRYSDSAFAERDPGVTADLGFIKKTDSVNTNSLTIVGSFRIVSEGSSLAGQTLNKVGRTTGWTQGQVTGTCVNTGVSGTKIVQLCQDFVNAGVGSGDSGSPVFIITNGNDVELRGILWGSSGETLFVYSPIANIERSDELGSIITTVPPLVLTSIVVSPPSATLTVIGTQTFNATALNGSTPLAGVNISWMSSNTTVGTVTSSYGITGSDGNASVTFTASQAGTTLVNATNGSVIGTASVTVNPLPQYTPSTPVNLTSRQGNFWINYSWASGQGNKTDSYNVSVNGTWTNGSTSNYSNNSGLAPHGWSNITVRAYNNSGKLSDGAIVASTQVNNNMPVQAHIGDRIATAGNCLNFTVLASDADSDTITYGTNASRGSLNRTTGNYSWQTGTGDIGIYTWYFNSSDGYGGVANETINVTVNPAPVPPAIIGYAPPSPVSNIQGDSRVFNITVNQTVNVTWYLNGTQAGFNESVINANYTNTSASVGIWNLTAIAQNVNGTDSQQWIWNVTAAPAYYNLSGYISDKSSGLPLGGALVETNTSLFNYTKVTGFYNFTVTNGTYIVNASLAGYVTNSTTVTISGADVTNANISITPIITTKVTVFVRGGLDNGIWYKNGSGSSWSGWQSLGGTITSNISATTSGSNITMFVRGGPDNGIWYQFWGGSSWSGWRTLGGTITSDPTSVSSAGQTYVFVRGGPDNGVWYRNGTGTSYSGWQSLGGTVTSNIAATSSGSNITIFVRGSPDKGILYQNWDGSSWSGWQSLGGTIISDPASVSSAGQTFVFVRGGPDNGIWYRNGTGTSYSGWRSLGGNITSNIAATSSGSNITIFVRGGPDNGIWYRNWDGVSWSGWQGLGGTITSDPASVSSAGQTYVFVRGGPDNGIWYRNGTGTSYIGWQGLGGLITGGPVVTSS